MEQDIDNLKKTAGKLEERVAKLERTSGPEIIEEILKDKKELGERIKQLEERVKELDGVKTIRTS